MESPTSFSYLGPAGTYTEIALKKFYSPKQSIPCGSIAAVFEAVASGRTEAGLVPLESFSQGPVTETLDLLVDYRDQLHIAASVSLPIHHALGVLSDKELKNFSGVQKIFGHPQALQQCRRSLNAKLPSAEFVETSSNGEAVERVKQEPQGSTAAVAAAETLSAQGLRVIATEIGDYSRNATRFALLMRGRPILAERKEANGDYVTSIAINPRRDRQGLLVDLLQVISIQQRININSIHSRPDRKGGFIFFLDLDGYAGNESLRSCLEALEHYCRHDTGATAEVILLGSYSSSPFQAPPFRSVGIIGGRGAMGGWFERFFTRAGADVHLYDLSNTPSLSEVVKESDVILLSIPMGAVSEIAPKLAECLRPGQLVVENCSIKSSALPSLLTSLPPGVELLGMHTMFGDSTANLTAQNIVFTRTERSGALSEGFEALFYKWGAYITASPLQEHDQATAYVQSLCHLLLIALADTCNKGGFSPDELAPFHTPNSRALFEAAQRVAYQNDSLISDLQLRNPESIAARDRFLEVLFRLIFSLNQGEQRELLESLHGARAFFESRRK